jgi:hypothetical protein
MVKQLDRVMAELEKLVETADDKKLQAWASERAHIGTRTMRITWGRSFPQAPGSWNPEKGVK